MENRDIWEYKLNLNKQETRILVAHLWELQDVNFNYYYTSENCSFRLLELLEVARPSVNLIEQLQFTTIPSDTIRVVAENDFIESVEYRPSQAVLLQQQLNLVPAKYHGLIENLSEKIEVLEKSEFIDLGQNMQKEIVNAAYQYLRYQTTGSERSPASSKLRFQLLSQLNSFPRDAGLPENEPILPVAPNLGHRSRMTSLALGYDQDRIYTELAYRQNYHDLLDNPKGYFSGAQINFFDLQLRVYEDGDFRLQQLELLNIMSISPRNRFFNPVSWRVSTGVNYQNYNQEDKLTVFLKAGAGLSYQFFEQGLNDNFLNFLVAHNADLRDVIEPGLGVTIGQLFYSGLGTSKLEFDSQNYLDGSYLFMLGFEHNFVVDVNQALRFSVRQEWNQQKSFNHVELSYRYYF